MGTAKKPAAAQHNLVRITFELDPYGTAIDLWHTHEPIAGEEIFLANSEWTVIKADHEVTEFRGQWHTITRYVLGNEQPAVKPAG